MDTLTPEEKREIMADLRFKCRLNLMQAESCMSVSEEFSGPAKAELMEEGQVYATIAMGQALLLSTYISDSSFN